MTGHVVSIIGEIVALTGLAIVGALALRRKKGHGVSILIPFRCSDPTNQRVKNLEWLKQYWANQLPGAEIIVGDDPSTDRPFSKSVAVNNAVAKAKGDVFVIVDADGYIDVGSVLHCVNEIRQARKKGRRLWFVPYRQFYRLNQDISAQLLQSDPANPLIFSVPLAEKHILGDTDPKVGHWYGAMIQIMPREAFDIVGGWDERFRGWGGEDHAAMRAMDTLYVQHKTLPGQVLHVWHPQLGPNGAAVVVHWKERMWENQEQSGANDELSNRYYGAYRNPVKMRRLLEEGRKNSSVRSSEKYNHSHRHSF